MARKEDDRFIYVIGFKGRPDWPCKIGVATDIVQRFGSHQTSSPWELEILVTMPGDEDVEAQLHAHFFAKRVRGEWFQLDEADLA